MEANNVKNMLDALKSIVRAYEDGIIGAVGNYPSIEYSNRVDSIFKKAKDALLAPIRNCDVGTAEERMYRYNRLRDEINERYERFGEIPPSFAFPTAFEWEDSPYESEEKSRGCCNK